MVRVILHSGVQGCNICSDSECPLDDDDDDAVDEYFE